MAGLAIYGFIVCILFIIGMQKLFGPWEQDQVKRRIRLAERKKRFDERKIKKKF